MRIAFALAVILLVAVQPSCSLFASSTQAVTITPSDAAADVYIDGQHVGVGVVQANLKRNDSHAIMARIGDRVATASISTKISTTGVLDIAGGILFLVPLIGIAGPGFWSLDQTNVVLAIPPEPRGPEPEKPESPVSAKKPEGVPDKGIP